LRRCPIWKGSCVVTGGNIGLGYWTARHLASRQAAVVLACRSLDRCEPAAAEIRAETGNPHGAVCMEMDLASFASVRSFARSFSEMAEQTGVVISGLILNAGVMVPPFGLTEDGLETQIGVNHFGHFLLASLLRPSLEAAAASRLGVATVVVVSSNAHYNSYDEGIRPLEELNNEASYDRGKAYGQSKLANVLFAQELAERAGPSGILVNAVHPGAVETNLGRNLESAIQATLGGAALDWLKQHVLPTSERGLWHPKDASLTALYAAVSDEVRKGKVTGKYFHPIARPTTPHAHARNGTLQNWLWGVTEDYLAAH